MASAEGTIAPRGSVASVASTKGFTTVVVAIDASPKAEDAVKYYLHHLHKENHRIVLVNIIELPDTDHARQQYLSPNALAEMWQEELQKSKLLEDKYAELFKAAKVCDVSIRKEGGMKPGAALCSVAESEKAGLIVIGTRGMGTIRRTIMGSVSDYVVHHAKCPVVVCRKAKDFMQQVGE